MVTGSIAFTAFGEHVDEDSEVSLLLLPIKDSPILGSLTAVHLVSFDENFNHEILKELDGRELRVRIEVV